MDEVTVEEAVVEDVPFEYITEVEPVGEEDIEEWENK